MAELAGDIVAPGHRLAADDQAAAHAGAENDAQHRRVAAELVVPGFRQRKAVGVVIDAHLAPDQRRQIARQRPPHRRRHVGGKQRAVIVVGQARNTDADAAAPAAKRIRLKGQIAQRGQQLPVIFTRRRHPLLPNALQVVVEHPQLNLGAAHIETVVHNPSPG